LNKTFDYPVEFILAKLECKVTIFLVFL